MNRSVFLVATLGIASLTAGCSVDLLKLKRAPKSVAVAACDPDDPTCIQVQIPDETTPRPRHRAGTASAGRGFVEGQSAATLDTTSEAEKQAALDTTSSNGERELGKTIASLGDVSEQGFWLRTPMVKTETEGRLVWADNGNSIKVTLIPRDGEASGGSLISLAAMRALGIPLTALADLIVFAK